MRRAFVEFINGLAGTGDGSGIDFAASQLTLLNPNGTPIVGKPNNDGRGKMTLLINGLTTDGNYTIRVQASDRAGNGSNAPFETSFTFSSSIPVVITKVPNVAYEIEKNRCGIAIEYNKNELVGALIKLLTDEKMLIEFRKNAIKMAKKYTWDIIYNNALRETL